VREEGGGREEGKERKGIVSESRKGEVSAYRGVLSITHSLELYKEFIFLR
jgi:hypothetical protein